MGDVVNVVNKVIVELTTALSSFFMFYNHRDIQAGLLPFSKVIGYVSHFDNYKEMVKRKNGGDEKSCIPLHTFLLPVLIDLCPASHFTPT